MGPTRSGVRTTVFNAKAACRQDRVNRVFKADRPNQLWVSDFTCVSCAYLKAWPGFACVAFPVDELAQRVRAAHRGLAREARQCTPTSCWTRWSGRCVSGKVAATGS